MDYQMKGTLEETTAYFRNLWRPMASECVLKNLKRILIFLQSPAEEVCVVNMQEKYLPFFYMIVLDEEFLQTTFLTDECKVATHEILRTLEANINSFTWEVSFSRQIAGIPVVFKKVYTKKSQVHPRERHEIRSAFKETWIKTTLKFIKSSKLILKYPEMPRREAMYIYKGILKLNDEELGLDSLWIPVWEALNIFKLRYEYIVSIHPTSFDYLKFVHFEKVLLNRKGCALEDKSPNSQWNINDAKTVTGDTDDIKNKVISDYRVANDILLPDINHKELLKTLLEKNVTKSGTIKYTLKVDGHNMVTKPLNENLDEVNKSFCKDIPPVLKNEAVELVTRIPNDELLDISLSPAVQDEGNVKNFQEINLNVVANVEDPGFSQRTQELIDNPSISPSKIDIVPYHNSNENIDSDTIASKNIVEQATKLLDHTVNKNAIKDVNANDAVEAASAENEINYSNKESQLSEGNTVIDEIGKSDKPYSINENPFIQQISKVQKQNSPVYVKEDEFGIIDDESEMDYTTNDFILMNEREMVDCYNDSPQRSGKNKNKKKKINPPLSEKALRRREARRINSYNHKILRKRRLINTVPTDFIIKSFKAILDFINNDSRPIMEIVSLNIHEFNVLRHLYSFSPDVVPIEKVFHESCWYLAKDIFNRLNEKKEILEVHWVIPHDAESNTSGDPTRRRSVTYKKKNLKKPKNNKNPVSILEKMCLLPIKTETSPGRRRESPGDRGSQSRSVSPPRYKMVPTGQRPAAVITSGNLTTTMKANMLEKLAVPLESDKAIRMMRLMGWKGGALGVREGGLIEPIQPQLDVAKGVGLGYETKTHFKSTNVCINRFQKKGVDEMYVPEKKAGNLSENIDCDISIDNKTKKENIVAEIKQFDKPNLKGDTNIDYIKESLINISNHVVETQNNSNEVVSKSNEDFDGRTIPSSIENNTFVNTCDDSIRKTKLEADSTGKMEGSGCLTNESLSQKIKNNPILSTNMKDNVKDKSVDHMKVMMNRQVVRQVEQYEPYNLYIRNKPTPDALCVCNRTQFLLHLLALLQSDQKIFTVVRYVRKLSEECVRFIDSIIWSLNRRVGPTPIPLPSESRIVDTCLREMEAHVQMFLSYWVKKRLLCLQKSDAFSDICPKLSYTACMVEFSFEITHSVNDLYCHMPKGKEDIQRSKIITNTIIRDFVKSNDMSRVYDYGQSSNVIRWYIISLISLLNRQITEYHQELENSEHSIFRETLNSMKNLCLLFRFNTQESDFTELQLVKVDLTQRCGNCYLTNKLVDNFERTVTPHIDGITMDDINICRNNLGYSTDDAISKIDKDVIVDEINNENICGHTVYATYYTDKVKVSEEYLTGERGIDSKVNEETDSKNESENDKVLSADPKFTKCIEIDSSIQNDASQNEINSNKYIINNDKEENITDEEMCSNLNNWPKRIKKSESYNNFTNDNIKWNTIENYTSNFRNILKRKIINLEEKTVKTVTEELNVSIENTVNSKDTTGVENGKDINMQLNTEERCTNRVEDSSEMKTNADVVTSECLIKDEENTEDKTLDTVDPIVGEKPIIKDSNTQNVTATDITWPKKILVVHYKYPEYEIDAVSVMSLQSLLYDAIIADQYLPRLKCNGLKKGGIIYTCYDYSTYVWLFKHLQWYTLLDYEENSDNNNLIQMKINTFITVDTDVMFKNIERLYGDIKACSWKVLQIKYFTDYCVLTVEVDDSSMDAIKKEDYSLFVGIDKADISVVYDKVK